MRAEINFVLGLAAFIALGFGLIWLTRVLVLRRRDRRTLRSLPAAFMTGGAKGRRARHHTRGASPAAYFRAMREKPGNAWLLLMFLGYAAVNWREKGPEPSLITLGVVAVLLFPCCYLVWRRWGPWD